MKNPASALPTDDGSTPQRTVFIKTYGCQMNVYDSQRMSDALARQGYVASDSPAESDLVILNTCHIREKAAEKMYSELGRVRDIKHRRHASGKETIIAVAGCVAQAEGEEILARAPSVDMVIGPQSYHHIGSFLDRVREGGQVVATDFAIDDKFSALPAPSREVTRSRGVSAFLTVQEGCDKFCTFCVVPYTRGAEVSRSVAQITEEAGRLADSGVREITLLGQNVNAWHGRDSRGRTWRLGQLLEHLSAIPGIERLRYTTSHPVDMDEDLIAAHGSLPKLMPYLHLPVQAGSDSVLRAMNRHHSREQYLDIIARIRRVRSDIAISGDFIVGFPGETDADFRQTLELVEEVGYAQAFSFKYSPRPGTSGAELPDQVPEARKAERLAQLQDLLRIHQLRFNRACIGRRVDILLEKPGRQPGQLIGRSPWLQSVIVDETAGEIGQMVSVDIVDGGPNSLHGNKVADL